MVDVASLSDLLLVASPQDLLSADGPSHTWRQSLKLAHLQIHEVRLPPIFIESFQRSWGLLPHGMVLSYVDLKSWCEDFIFAFYGAWILSTLVLGKAMEERLDSIGREDLIHMMAVVQALVHDCPDNDKIYLGVSHRLRVMGRKPVSRCHFDVDWVKANLKISEA